MFHLLSPIDQSVHASSVPDGTRWSRRGRTKDGTKADHSFSPVRDGPLSVPDGIFPMPLYASSVPDGTRWSRRGRTKDNAIGMVLSVPDGAFATLKDIAKQCH